MGAYSEEIEKCLRYLNKEGIILYPTDTIWGLGGDASSSIAIRKIYEIKRRSDSKSLVSLVSDVKMLESITKVSSKVKQVLSESSRPTTIIYSNANQIHSMAKASDGSAAIRIVQDDFCKELIEKLGRPLLSTSANISGTPSPSNFNDVSKNISRSCDFIVSHRKDENSMGVASRILKVDEDEIIIIRE